MKIVSAGYGNYVNADKIQAIAKYGSAPIKRAVQEARKANLLIDVTEGSRTNSVIFLNDGFIVLSANQTNTLEKRFNKDGED